MEPIEKPKSRAGRKPLPAHLLKQQVPIYLTGAQLKKLDAKGKVLKLTRTELVVSLLNLS